MNFAEQAPSSAPQSAPWPPRLAVGRHQWSWIGPLIGEPNHPGAEGPGRLTPWTVASVSERLLELARGRTDDPLLRWSLARLNRGPLHALVRDRQVSRGLPFDDEAVAHEILGLLLAAVHESPSTPPSMWYAGVPHLLEQWLDQAEYDLAAGSVSLAWPLHARLEDWLAADPPLERARRFVAMELSERRRWLRPDPDAE